ncbi:ABC transporter substrate-binding protein [Epibacterium ulvae]|uniref:ABC transporter substrate-binding protein n=1 Tax=Epibacterium ulvae TaxID=1156985 RepID=UPI00249083C6|nr:ABC transporter substrate-binding protein [Epibacterium ulvae]
MTTTILRMTLAASLLATSALAEDAAGFRENFLSGAAPWETVTERAADEGTVNLYYWGGSDPLNIWMDQVVTPDLAKLGVTLNPVRITGTKDAIDLVLAEKGAGKALGAGSVDAIWVNGENFATLKRQDALFGSFADKLPNSAHFEWDETDPRALLNLRDFGLATEAAEVPWSGEQYVCAVNTGRVEHAAAPTTFAELRTYLEAHPGKFSYVKPPHWLGNTFVQAALYAHNPDGSGATPFQETLDSLGAAELARLVQPGFEYLKSIEPLLLGAQSGNIRYPEDGAALNGLFLNGEIDFACQFGLYAVATNLANGTFPEGAQSFIFPKGNMIKNKNYLAIPSNAPNPAAALVLANYMSSVAAQASKLQFTGMPAGIDPWTLTTDEAETLSAAAPGYIGVTQAELDANTAPDTNATLVDVIEAVWLDYIERGSADPFDVIVARAVSNLSN